MAGVTTLRISSVYSSDSLLSALDRFLPLSKKGPYLSVNLLKSPSFIPVTWAGSTSSKIDFKPWQIEKNQGGFVLEKKPSGSCLLRFFFKVLLDEPFCIKLIRFFY